MKQSFWSCAIFLRYHDYNYRSWHLLLVISEQHVQSRNLRTSCFTVMDVRKYNPDSSFLERDYLYIALGFGHVQGGMASF